MSEKKIRVLMSKPGIDGHWRGGIVVSRAIRDAGMELIFGGFQNVQQIVETAIQEDVDVLGLSIHSGAHFAYTQQVIDLLKERGVFDDIMILVGGVIPAQDFAKLKEMGVANIYGPGSKTSDIVEFIKSDVNAYGTYHCCNSGSCSWYEFAAEIFDLCGLDADLSETTYAEYKTRAVRPRYSVMDNSKVGEIYKMPHWQEALKEYLKIKGHPVMAVKS